MTDLSWRLCQLEMQQARYTFQVVSLLYNVHQKKREAPWRPPAFRRRRRARRAAHARHWRWHRRAARRALVSAQLLEVSELLIFKEFQTMRIKLERAVAAAGCRRPVDEVLWSEVVLVASLFLVLLEIIVLQLVSSAQNKLFVLKRFCFKLSRCSAARESRNRSRSSRSSRSSSSRSNSSSSSSSSHSSSRRSSSRRSSSSCSSSGSSSSSSVTHVTTACDTRV